MRTEACDSGGWGYSCTALSTCSPELSVRTRGVSLFFLATAHGCCYFSLIWAVAVPEEGEDGLARWQGLVILIFLPFPQQGL